MAANTTKRSKEERAEAARRGHENRRRKLAEQAGEIAKDRKSSKSTKKVAKKKAKAKSKKKTRSTETASDWPGSKISKPFPVEVCRKCVDLTHSKHEDDAKISALKSERKDLRTSIRESEAEIDEVVRAEEEEGRGVKGEAFSADASAKIVSIQKDIDRWSKKAAKLKEQIRDLQEKRRDTQSELDRTIAGQDPTGTLFEPSDDKADES